MSLFCSRPTRLIDLRPINTTETSGTAPSGEEYEPQIFARVNYAAYHVFLRLVQRLLFFFLCPQSRKKNFGPEQFLDSYITMRYNFEHELAQYRSVLLKIGPVPRGCIVNANLPNLVPSPTSLTREKLSSL